MKTITLTTSLCVLLACPALAQDDGMAPTVEMGLNVTALVNDQLHQALDDEHANLIKLLAKQHAIAANCTGIVVDEVAAGALMARAMENIVGLPEEEQDAAYDTVMMGFAAQLGGQFAIAAYDYEAYCEHGRAELLAADGDETLSDLVVIRLAE